MGIDRIFFQGIGGHQKICLQNYGTSSILRRDFSFFLFLHFIFSEIGVRLFDVV
jgi:hypothetical protein